MLTISIGHSQEMGQLQRPQGFSLLLTSCPLGQARRPHSSISTTQKVKATFPLSMWKRLGEDLLSWPGSHAQEQRSMTDKGWAPCLSFYPGTRQPTLTAPQNHKNEFFQSNMEDTLVRLKDERCPH